MQELYDIDYETCTQIIGIQHENIQQMGPGISKPMS